MLVVGFVTIVGNYCGVLANGRVTSYYFVEGSHLFCRLFSGHAMSLRSNRIHRGVSVISFSLFLISTGCVDETVKQDGTHLFHYEWWVPLLTLVGGVAAAVIGFPLRKIISKLGVALILGGGIAAVVIAPSMYCDSVTIDERGFSLRTGVWGMTATHDFKYSDLDEVRYVIEHSVDRKGRDRSTCFILCQHKSGRIQKVPMANQVAKTATSQLFAQLSESGVSVLDDSGVSLRSGNNDAASSEPTTLRSNPFTE